MGNDVLVTKVMSNPPPKVDKLIVRARGNYDPGKSTNDSNYDNGNNDEGSNNRRAPKHSYQQLATTTISNSNSRCTPKHPYQQLTTTDGAPTVPPQSRRPNRVAPTSSASVRTKPANDTPTNRPDRRPNRVAPTTKPANDTPTKRPNQQHP